MKWLVILLLTTSSCNAESPVVRITGKAGAGSGFVVVSDGNTSGIVTNLHVCSSNYDQSVFYKVPFKYQDLKVITERKIYKADILSVDPSHDLCFLMVYTSLPTLNLSIRTHLTYKELLLVLSPSPYNLHAGRFIGEDKKLDLWSPFHKDSYVIRGTFVHGQSGSPVLDRKKEVVGVFWGVVEDPKLKLGFIIGPTTLYNFITQSEALIYRPPNGIVEIQ